MNLWEFEASLVYRVSSRTARAVTQTNPVSCLGGNRYIYYKEVYYSFFLSNLYPLDTFNCHIALAKTSSAILYRFMERVDNLMLVLILVELL